MWILVAVLLSAPLVEYPYAPDGVIARFNTLIECSVLADQLTKKLAAEDMPPFKLTCKSLLPSVPAR